MISTFKVIATKKLDTEMVREYSTHVQEIGKRKSTMELWRSDDGDIYIEWDIPSLDEGVEISFDLDGMNIEGYEGIMSVPQEAIDLLEANGYNCDEIKD